MTTISLDIIEDKTQKFKILLKIGLIGIIIFIVDLLIVENFIIENLYTKIIAGISGLMFVCLILGQNLIDKFILGRKFKISEEIIEFGENKFTVTRLIKLKLNVIHMMGNSHGPAMTHL